MPKYALLIGVSSDSQSGSLKPFPSAKRNVEAMGRILLMPEVGGFADVRAVFDPDPMQMQEAVEEFFRQRSPHDLALCFFSGQLVRDERGKLYFTTQRTRHTPEGALVKYTAVPASFVQDLMGGSLARQQTLILDCGIGGTPNPAQRNGALSLQNQLGGETWAVMLSSDSARPQPEHNGSDLSLYTHSLIEGMATGAADLDRDGLVSVRDLHTYTTQQLRQVTADVVPQLLASKEAPLQVAIARVPILDSKRQYQERVRQYVEDGGLSPIGRTILDRLRSQLHLSAAEALTIETEVLQPFREQWENLQKYRRALEKALDNQYPLSDRTLRELRELQEVLALTDEQVTPLQETTLQPFAERAAQQQQRRSHYQQAFEHALTLQFPLPEATQQQLQKLRTSLGLTPVDVRSLEREAIAHYQTAQETRYRHRQRYRDALLQAVEIESPISSTTRVSLQKLQHSLGLTLDETAQIEQQVNQEVQAKRALYRGHLTMYQQEFEAAIAHEPIPSKPRRDRLQQLQNALGLRDVDIIQAEASAIRHHHLHRYEQEFSRRMSQMFLPNDAALEQLRQELQPLQTSLMLDDADVAPIQRQLAAHARAKRQDYHHRLRQYGEIYVQALRQTFPIPPEVRPRLEQSWLSLGLREVDAQNVEQVIEQRWQQVYGASTPNSPTSPNSTPHSTAQSSPTSSSSNLNPTPPTATASHPSSTQVLTDLASPAQPPNPQSQELATMPSESAGSMPVVSDSTVSDSTVSDSIVSDSAASNRTASETDASVSSSFDLITKPSETSTVPAENSPEAPTNPENFPEFEGQVMPPPPPDGLSSSPEGTNTEPVQPEADPTALPAAETNAVDEPVSDAAVPESNPSNSPDSAPSPPLEDNPFAAEAVPPTVSQPSEGAIAPPSPPEPAPSEPAAEKNPFDAATGSPVPPPPDAAAPASTEAPPPPSAPPANSDDLSSDRGIDYATLRELLSLSQWREADQLTFHLMLQAAGRISHGWLDAASLDSFPCTDLHTLNQLWLKYSGMRFGFSVQRKLYLSINKPKLDEAQLALEFGKAVNWVLIERFYPIFKPYEQLDFAPRAALGHLPARWFWVLPTLEAVKSGSPGLGRSLGGKDRQGMMAAMVKRLGECNL